MKNDKSLLSLEKKLENSTTEERILNKFKFKPNIDVSEIKKGSIGGLGNLKEFLQNFKKSNDELLNDQNAILKANIESEANTNKSNKDKKDQKFIEMNLGLGILEKKENKEEKTNKDNLLNKIIETKKEKNEEEDFKNPFYDTEIDNQLINFLLNSKSKTQKRRRLHFIHK